MVEHDLKPADWLVQTAAGSTVGRLVLQLARSERFRTVNIVRRRAQVSEIKALGGDVVITSEDDDWVTQLATASEGKALSRAIDCVAGRTGRSIPIRHGKKTYRDRHLMEIMFGGRLKDWRRIHARYDRCAHTSMSAIAIAAVMLFWMPKQ